MKRIQMQLAHWWHLCRDFIRRLSGDDAYERYLVHYAEMHEITLNPPPKLTRKAFYREFEENRWNGPNRCC